MGKLAYNFDELFSDELDKEPFIVQKQKLSLVEEARAIEEYIENKGITQSRLAEELGISRSVISKTLRILKLSPERQRIIEELNLKGRNLRNALYIKTDSEFYRFIGKIQNVSTVETKNRLILIMNCQIKS